jgi:hypothetical protein
MTPFRGPKLNDVSPDILRMPQDAMDEVAAKSVASPSRPIPCQDPIDTSG